MVNDLSQLNRTFPKSDARSQQTDDELLGRGTLWMKQLGVGFKLARGRIVSLYLCDPTVLPETGLGQFTDGAQRHQSERMQLASFKTQQAQTPRAKPPMAERTLKIGLMFMAIVAIVFFGWRAWEQKKRWDNSTEVQAEVISVWPEPPDPFPTKFQLTYQDQHEETHTVELAQSDVYSTPQIGDRIALRYLPESPQSPLVLSSFAILDLIFSFPTSLYDSGLRCIAPYQQPTHCTMAVRSRSKPQVNESEL